jgi:hypothetical protein
VGLDLASQPLIDREDFEELAAQGIFGTWLDQARAMRQEGFCVLRGVQPDLPEICQGLKAKLSLALDDEIRAWQTGESGPPRLQDGWLLHPEIRELCLLPAVLELLSSLYGRKPIPFQSLNFAIGSQQPVHSDAVHFHCYPHGFMCGVWIALEDVQPESGPLMYYPGSHRLPYLSAEDLLLSPSGMSGEKHPQKFFQHHWDSQIQHSGLSKQLFHPRCGDILIWHANLLHGGEAVLNPALSRWSQVNHYYFADCLYTTPIHSCAAFLGGTHLRNPYNIATNQRIFSASEWRNLEIHTLTDHSPSAPKAKTASKR